jgi:probable phosphoglycerate mutase
MTSTRLLIARHGNTFGPGDIVRRVGTTDLPLVLSGLIQARQLGLYLKSHALTPDLIITSQLKRAIQTAEEAQIAMGTHLPIQSIAGFNEIDYGLDENKPEIDVIARIGQRALQAWEADATVPDGWQVDPALMIKHWQDFAHTLASTHMGKTILIVTSNGIARFAPHITGDFKAFSQQHGIKLATGAFGLFETSSASDSWRCLQWNVRPPPIV